MYNLYTSNMYNLLDTNCTSIKLSLKIYIIVKLQNRTSNTDNFFFFGKILKVAREKSDLV